LVQSAESFKIFLGDHAHLVKLKIDAPANIAAYNNDIPERIENFSNIQDRKEVLLDKFILHIDKELGHILNKHNLPVFVLGTERINGHFKKYTHHSRAILDYIHGNYDDSRPHQLLTAIRPYLCELVNVERKELQQQIEEARNANRLSIGIDEVWRNATEKKGRLLLVEKNYSYPGTPDGKAGNGIVAPTSVLTKDSVDLVIEKVVEYGGKVQFADAAVMDNLQHIAMFLYY
jgi:sRNA-binding carbon storage regulator CsrA